MVRVVLFHVLLLAATSCRLFMPEKYEARDRCAAVLPVLREFPERPYRIVGGKTVAIAHEQALRYEACAVYSDAVVVRGEDASRRGVLVGVFIKYTSTAAR